MVEDRLGGLLNETGRNAALGWAITIGLLVLGAVHALDASYRWVVFTVAAVLIVVSPAVAFRDPQVLPPWELVLLVAIPVIDATVFGPSVLSGVAVYVAVAALALVVAVQIHRFTPVRMNHTFAIALVIIATLAGAALWNIAQWGADLMLGTTYIRSGRSQDAANVALMMDFVYATAAGFLAGIIFDRYFRVRSTGASDRTAVPTIPRPDGDDEATPAPAFIRGRLNVPEGTVRNLSRSMQVGLGGLLVYGLLARDVPTITNASLALVITFLPTVLTRDRQFSLEPELIFWLTGAVFLHALGSAGLYDLIGVWDNVTHVLSATVVAAAGYAVVRGLDLYTDEVYLPPKMLFVFLLLFVLAAGVVWELLEFLIDQSARSLGQDAALAQHGIDDTVLDLVFDLVGAVITAVWGSIYLTDVSHRIAATFDA